MSHVPASITGPAQDLIKADTILQNFKRMPESESVFPVNMFTTENVDQVTLIIGVNL